MQRLRWPLPAVLVWLACWGLFKSLLPQGAELALLAACALAAAGSLWGSTWWRRIFIAAGFPLSLLLTQPGLIDLPAWLWLIPLVLLALVYPLNAWRDAPLFPTPHDALRDLPARAPLSEGAKILDAGCGLGDALIALRAVYPQAQLSGLEWSWPLRLLCGLRCPWARVRRGDIWAADWSSYDMVYLFQRPESMGRAATKAMRELRPGAWLVSLEFEADRLQSVAQIPTPGGRMLWLYQAPPQAPSGE